MILLSIILREWVGFMCIWALKKKKIPPPRPKKNHPKKQTKPVDLKRTAISNLHHKRIASKINTKALDLTH